jgi:hypothetical protein
MSAAASASKYPETKKGAVIETTAPLPSFGNETLTESALP